MITASWLIVLFNQPYCIDNKNTSNMTNLLNGLKKSLCKDHNAKFSVWDLQAFSYGDILFTQKFRLFEPAPIVPSRSLSCSHHKQKANKQLRQIRNRLSRRSSLGAKTPHDVEDLWSNFPIYLFLLRSVKRKLCIGLEEKHWRRSFTTSTSTVLLSYNWQKINTFFQYNPSPILWQKYSFDQIEMCPVPCCNLI